MTSIIKEFDTLAAPLAQSRVSIRRATAEDIVAVYPPEYANAADQLADRSTCERIRQANRDNIWTIVRRSNQQILGFYAMVMLSEAGQSALLMGRFAAHDPAMAHIAADGAPVAAIYKWGVHAPGIAAGGIPLVAARLQMPGYRQANLYGTGTTIGGRRIMVAQGFVPRNDPRTPGLFEYRRLANRSQSAASAPGLSQSTEGGSNA